MTREKIVATAKAMAKAEGYEPNSPLQQPARVAGLPVGMWDSDMPAWQYYEGLATAVLAAIETSASSAG